MLFILDNLKISFRSLINLNSVSTCTILCALKAFIVCIPLSDSTKYEVSFALSSILFSFTILYGLLNKNTKAAYRITMIAATAKRVPFLKYNINPPTTAIIVSIIIVSVAVEIVSLIEDAS